MSTVGVVYIGEIDLVTVCFVVDCVDDVVSTNVNYCNINIMFIIVTFFRNSGSNQQITVSLIIFESIVHQMEVVSISVDCRSITCSIVIEEVSISCCSTSFNKNCTTKTIIIIYRIAIFIKRGDSIISSEIISSKY